MVTSHTALMRTGELYGELWMAYIQQMFIVHLCVCVCAYKRVVLRREYSTRFASDSPKNLKLVNREIIENFAHPTIIAQ